MSTNFPGGLDVRDSRSLSLNLLMMLFTDVVMHGSSLQCVRSHSLAMLNIMPSIAANVLSTGPVDIIACHVTRPNTAENAGTTTGAVFHAAPLVVTIRDSCFLPTSWSRTHHVERRSRRLWTEIATKGYSEGKDHRTEENEKEGRNDDREEAYGCKSRPFVRLINK